MNKERTRKSLRQVEHISAKTFKSGDFNLTKRNP